MAEQVLSRFSQVLPIDIERIVREYSIDIQKRPIEDGVSGMLVIKNDKAVIGVNANNHENRQRFTIAHELGHYLLHRDSSNIFVDSHAIFYRDDKREEGVYLQEIEANIFAAAILMPENILRSLIDKEIFDPFDDEAIHSLASRFKVSSQALTIRMTKLRLLLT